MKNALRIMCLFTVLATVYLSLSLIISQPPRANFQAWFAAAALFVAQGVLTLVATSRTGDRKSTRLNSSHGTTSRMPSSA